MAQQSMRSRAKTPAIASLVALTLQNATLALVLHASRKATPKRYYAPSAVLLTEAAKALISAALALRALGGLTLDNFHYLHRLACSRSALPLTLPAILYVVQNNLQYTAAGNLEPAMFQTLYQLKILTTALCASFLLGTRLANRQWVALFFLALGVAIVQVCNVSDHAGPPTLSSPPSLPPISPLARPATADARHIPSTGSHAQIPPPPSPPSLPSSPIVGFFAVLCACFTSGIAGVWFEKVLKRPGHITQQPLARYSQGQQQQQQHHFQPMQVIWSKQQSEDHSESRRRPSYENFDEISLDSAGALIPPSKSSQRDDADSANLNLWVRNLQLSLFSIVPAVVPVLAACISPFDSSGSRFDVSHPWRNFGVWAWSIVALQTTGGLLTACVMRWADNILKCFAVALALLLTSLLSILLFDFYLTPSFILGASLTLAATTLYQTRPKSATGVGEDGQISTTLTANGKSDKGLYMWSREDEHSPERLSLYNLEGEFKALTRGNNPA